MIGRLHGTVIDKRPPWLLLDVHGVGYEIEVPLSLFTELPAAGESLVLITHLQVKEDGHSLYGFLEESQRSLFRALLKISGVGPRIALAILSGASPEQFAAQIQEGDVSGLTRVPGIGKKTAERLVVELRDKLEAPSGGATLGGSSAGGGSEAQAALQALGYKPQEAAQMIKAVAEPGLETAELIRRALQQVASRR
ncbi:MAG: Holliday junction branch migration protein RuvA [Wenzhouxiangellaceae bacterium]